MIINFIMIIVCLVVVAIPIIIWLFAEVEVCRLRYNGWLYRGIKHIKCGAVVGHEYENGICKNCGKREPKKK